MNKLPNNTYNKTPILILAFNRPKLLLGLLKKIKKFEPRKLYISIDGARNNNQLDKILIKKINEEILKEITWKCSLFTQFLDSNYGVRKAPVLGIDWFFQYEEMGIILEDDVIPDQSFFIFSNLLLKKYKNDSKIMMISGNNYINSNLKIIGSYYFSKSPGTHGWATWKRAWEKFDLDMKNLSKLDFFKILKYFNFDIAKTHFFYKRFVLCYNKKIQTWDYQHYYSIIKNDGLIIKPVLNLCKHIGWESETGEESTHGKGKDDLPHIKIQTMKFPLVHPNSIKQNFIIDKKEDKELRKLYFFKYFFFLLKKKLKFIS